MSLRGRYVIDRIKRVVHRHLKMPVPPYGDPRYWDQVYQTMETASQGQLNPHTNQLDFDDSFEWGGVSLSDVMQYNYQPVIIGQDQGDYASRSSVEDTAVSTTFGETIGVPPTTMYQDHHHSKEPILMLGCGNSKMGEQMVDEGWRGPIIQVDIAKQCLEMIARRTHYDSSRLEFVEDDATQLTTFAKDTMEATIDKGLIDALFCADEYTQCTDVMKAVLRTLKPGGIFCLFSLSRPEFLLPKILPVKGNASLLQPGRPTWTGLQMQQVSDVGRGILIYRFEKSKSALREPNKKNRKNRTKSTVIATS